MRSLRSRTPTALALVAASVLVAGVGGAPVSSAGTAPAPPEVSASGEYLIQFQPGSARRLQATRELRAEGIGLRAVATAVPISSATLTPDQAAAIAQRADVVAVAPNYQRYALDTESGADLPWGLDRTDQIDLPLDQSYSYPAGAGAGTTIYVLDTGINSAHVEFTGRLAPGTSFILDGYGTEDCNGHGTHVTGIAAGTRYGIAKLATIVPVRVLDCDGTGDDEGVNSAMQWVIDDHDGGRAIVNLSLGGPPSPVLDNMIAAVVDDGMVVVVAAGNSSKIACNYSPARAPAALTVGATTNVDARWSNSNYGSCLDLFAPGAEIISAYKGSPAADRSLSGTSMASPHVAGSAAVLWADHPSFTPAQVEAVLLANATPDRVTDAGVGSPNRLLHLPAVITPPPPPPPPPPVFTARAATAIEPAQRCSVSPDC